MPWADWLKDPLKDHVINAISDKNFWRQHNIDNSIIQNNYKNFLNGDKSIIPNQIVSYVMFHNRGKNLTL